MVKCPECGGNMEKGTLGTDGVVMSWMNNPLSLRGDTLMKGLTNCSIGGFRCPHCRLVMVHY
jgi:uncharacterized OB-fold protein